MEDDAVFIEEVHTVEYVDGEPVPVVRRFVDGEEIGADDAPGDCC